MPLSFGRREALGLAALWLVPREADASTNLRVASMDWALTETMLALGRKPLAIVAAVDWRRFVVEPALPAGVADLGLQQEINLELLASLEPNLILSSPFLANLEPALQRIAKTVSLSIFEKAALPLSQPRVLAEKLGLLLDCEAAARRYLALAEQKFDEYRKRVAGLGTRPVLLVNFIDARHVRVYGGSGLFQNVLDRLGVVNAWTGATNYWGFSTLGIEQLATDKDLRLITFEPIPADALPTLERSPLWSMLPFVRAKRVSVLPAVFMFGAMPSALRFARLLVAALEGTSR